MNGDKEIEEEKEGKNIMWEKKMEMKIGEDNEMMKEEREEGVVEGKNNNLRNEERKREMRDEVEEGRIGKVMGERVLNEVYLKKKLKGWRIERKDEGGGVVIDINVNDEDKMSFVMGENKVEEVDLSKKGGLSGEGMEDGVMGVLSFK